MAFACLVLSVLFSNSNAKEIELLECVPPDVPVWGGYDPKMSYYMPGDVVHYYCDTDTNMSGNIERKCLDTGDWSGDTPICDSPTDFKSVYQSSEMDTDSSAQAAVDGIRSTCTETIGGEEEEWYGNFTIEGQLTRVKLFLMKGPINFELILVKESGDEVVCGRYRKKHVFLKWIVQNCPDEPDEAAIGLKIRSLTTDPLIICEIQAFVITQPTCSDPHFVVENGHLRLTRKTATLVCDKGYTRSPSSKLDCVRDGEWSRKTLFCFEREWDVDTATGSNNENADEKHELVPRALTAP